MASSLNAPHMQSEKAAYAFVEAMLWPHGPVCPHGGCMGRIYAIAENQATRVRIGLKKCGDCRKQFTVKVGTVFEASHVPLNLWLQAIALICASKKGISSNQLHRTLGVTLKTAWFMSHRIREAMREGDLAPFGGGGGAVEVDETFIGRVKDAPVKQGIGHKMKVLSLVDRDTGAKRSIVLENMKPGVIGAIVIANVAREAHLMTDEAGHYHQIRENFAAHSTVNHGKDEYVRYTPELTLHTNTIEGSFSIFKRGMKGIYQHCGEQHLHRYLAEFDFRYSNRARLGIDDRARAELALKGAAGKRLTYKAVVAKSAPA